MPKNSRKTLALLAVILLIVVGCGGGIDAKRQALKAKAEKLYESSGTVVVMYGSEPEYADSDSVASVQVDSYNLFCFYRLNEDQTAWVQVIYQPGSSLEADCAPYFTLD